MHTLKRVGVIFLAVVAALGATYAGLSLTVDDSGPDAQLALLCVIALPVISIFLFVVGIWAMRKPKAPKDAPPGR